MSDINEDLKAAFEAIEGEAYAEPTDETIIPETDGAAPPEPPPETEGAGDTSPPGGTQPGAEPEPEPNGADPAPEPDLAAAAPAEPVAEEGIKPPLGFSPESREHWKDVPEIVKEQIHKREVEIAKAMETTAQARRTTNALNQLAQSYAPVMAAEGATDPLQAIQGLFDTVAQLRLGSPQQRAEKMAALISHYGVDIGALDAALVGEPVPEQVQGQHHIETLLDQRLAPINNMMETLNQMQMQKQGNAQQDAVAEVQEFGKNAEFLNDVRNDMADLIEMANARGMSMTLEEAYNKACALNPQIQAVLNQRSEAERLKTEQESLAAKQNAASSIAGRQIGGQSGGIDNSLRGTIASAWDEVAEG
jgi:hypothetical protein